MTLDRRNFIATAAALAFPPAIDAQTPAKKPRYDVKRKPDYRNVSYGLHERNVLDIYQARSGKPTPLILYIHGGGFVAGDKEKLSATLLDLSNKAGITIAAINYRYATQAPFPAPFQDAARALQFLRLHAAEYNLDPRAVAATGDSAGAVLSLWLGFHPDLADPAGIDPLKRQSTRLSVIGVTAAQTTCDPRVMARLIGEEIWQHPSLPVLFGLRPDELHTERAYKLYEEASPDTYLTTDDPAVFIFFDVPNLPMTPETPMAQRMHHPAFGFYLKEKMDKLGMECVIRLKADYKNPAKPLPVQMNEELVRFFVNHFPPSNRV